MAAALLLMFFPAAGVAAPAKAGAKQTERGESSETALSSAGLLAVGAGYSDVGGSRAVRELQLRLRAGEFQPGPIDGLFGPLTRGAVERFQQAHGLVVDGLVGPQTRKRLVPGRPERGTAAHRRVKAPDGSGQPNRSVSPERSVPHHGSPASAGAAGRPGAAHGASPRETRVEPAAPPLAAPAGGRESGSWTGLSPELTALLLAAMLGTFALGLTVIGVWAFSRWRREAGPGRAPAAPQPRMNLGIVCAALLGVFAMGAAVGALFASRAAPTESATGRAVSGTALRVRAAPAAKISSAAVARRARRLAAVDVAGRIASGTPDVFAAGERLRLP